MTNLITASGKIYELRWHGSVRQARVVGTENWIDGHRFVSADADHKAAKWFRENRALGVVK